MTLSDGASVYRLSYEVAPITLVGGVASGVPGGGMNLLSVLDNLALGGLTGDGDLGVPFAEFMPLPGGTLVENQYGTYPFANNTVAANARVKQPLAVSMLMRVPVRTPGGFDTKTQVMTALQNTLEQHVEGGGFFAVATPSFLYVNMLLLKLHDVSSGATLQTQVEYQWDFFAPLITREDAEGAQNAMMSLLSSGGATDGALSGVAPTIGAGGTGATPAVSPAASGAIFDVSGGGIGNGPGGGAGFGGSGVGEGIDALAPTGAPVVLPDVEVR